MSLKHILLVSAGVAMPLAFGQAEAMPVQAAGAAGPGLVLASGGCGPYAYRTRSGACRRGRVYVGRDNSPERQWKRHYGF